LAAYDAAGNYAREAANEAANRKRGREEEAKEALPGELQNEDEEVAKRGKKKAGPMHLEEGAWRRREEARSWLREARPRQGLRTAGLLAAGGGGEAGKAGSRQELLAAELRTAGEGGFACWTEARRRQNEAR
jgi:hypothetical protein